MRKTAVCDCVLAEGKDDRQVLEGGKRRELLPWSSLMVMSTAEITTQILIKLTQKEGVGGRSWNRRNSIGAECQ